MDKISWLAGISALSAVPTVLAAGVTVALFFRGAGNRYGAINDLLTAFALLLLVFPVLAIYTLYRGQAGDWLLLLSIGAIVGIAIAALGQVLLVIGLVGLNTSFATGGIGIVLLILWAVAFLILIFQHSPLPAYLGWLLLAVLALSAILTLASSFHWQTGTWVSSGLLVIVLCLWLATLGLEFLRQA